MRKRSVCISAGGTFSIAETSFSKALRSEDLWEGVWVLFTRVTHWYHVWLLRKSFRRTEVCLPVLSSAFYKYVMPMSNVHAEHCFSARTGLRLLVPHS